MSSSSPSASPFLDAESFEVYPVDEASPALVSSPFVQRFTLEAEEDESTTYDGARRLLLAELQDEEFDAAVYELAGEGARAIRNLADSRSASATLELTFAPLAREIDTTLRRARDHFGARSPATIEEGEVDSVLGEHSDAVLTPAMENFLGVLKRAVKGAVSLAGKGVALAAKLGLGPILEKIRKAMPGVIRKIMQAVIHRLPASVQPHARKLAGALNIPLQREFETETDEERDVAFDTSTIQNEFNECVADALTSETDSEADEAYEGVGWSLPNNEIRMGVHDLDAARERFISELSELEEGEDAAPAVERFIPALLPVMAIAKRLVGRQKVVSLLSGMVAKLIGKFVGPPSTKALSDALVDSGLKLVGFEVTPDSGRSSAHAAIAATVEETVRRVGTLTDDELNDRQQAEGAILREFERAASANFPPLLPSRVYRQRPDLMETDRRRGVWVQCPPAGSRKRFKKYTQVFRTRVTPRMAMVIPTFGGATLATFLNEQLGAEIGEELEAEVHLYEAMPGMLLSEIGDQESPGDASAAEYEFHPLTNEAASLLLGEPGLGQELPNVPASARGLRVGQRFYRLSVPGRRVNVGPKGRRRPRTHLHVTADSAKHVVTMRLYIGERRAQEMATALRNRAQAGAALARLRPHFERLLKNALSGHPGSRIRILHASLSATDARGPGLRKVPAATLTAFSTGLANAALGGLSAFLQGQSAQFIRASEDAKDGVTLRISITNPTGLVAVMRAISGTATAAGAPSIAAIAPPSATVSVMPGHHHG